jgi:ABC-type uncharacterized transport system substrate-binding protein
MRRREFITLLGGVAVGWPLAARAQQSERRIGALMSTAADEPEGQARLAAFRDGLRQLGWTDGRNVRIDIRWPASEPDSYRKYAGELVALGPDAILASSSARVAALQQVSQSVPIVFTNVVDPVGAGFVLSLSRPGGDFAVTHNAIHIPVVCPKSGLWQIDEACSTLCFVARPGAVRSGQSAHALRCETAVMSLNSQRGTVCTDAVRRKVQ